jgi:hypothetical protein
MPFFGPLAAAVMKGSRPRKQYKSMKRDVGENALALGIGGGLEHAGLVGWDAAKASYKGLGRPAVRGILSKGLKELPRAAGGAAIFGVGLGAAENIMNRRDRKRGIY